MDENHQNNSNNKLAVTDDGAWVVSKKSKLLIPRHQRPRRANKGWTGFSSKTLWDWLQLLIIPLVLATLGFLFNLSQAQINDANNAQQAKVSEERSIQQHLFDQQAALDQQRETTLQTYLDRMSDLMLTGNLDKSQPGDNIRAIARARTLTVLRQLDSMRKGILLEFLYESNLILPNRAKLDRTGIVDLSGADLSGAYLTGANLNGAVLDNVNLKVAYLREADLRGALLFKTDLSGADLRGANLEGADLSFSTLDGANLSIDTQFVTNDPTDIHNTNLNDARLSQASFYKANLDGADLTGADLSGTYMSYAHMRYATLSNEQLAQVASLEGATMPDGSIHP
jgi:uncharacterized protein YjbI with pentapeptide repeats